jgi:hypothetical protein
MGRLVHPPSINVKQLPNKTLLKVIWLVLGIAALHQVGVVPSVGKRSSTVSTEAVDAKDDTRAVLREKLLADPEEFTHTVRQSSDYEQLECNQDQQDAWEEAVQLRYNEYQHSCVTPDVLNAMVPPRKNGPSGPGSSLAATESLRGLLPQVFKELDVKTFMDCPCGDWLWMQTVDLTGIQYFGADITNVTVQKNAECFGSSNVHFNRFDLTCMVPPPVDLLLVRDVLFHLPEPTIRKVLSNINTSGARYLATTTFSKGGQGVWATGAYKDSLGIREKKGQDQYIGSNKINLYEAPFYFPTPLYKADEVVADPQNLGRHVGIWKLPLLLRKT